MGQHVKSAPVIAVLWLICAVWIGPSFANGGPAVPFYKEVAATGDYFVWGYGFFAKIFFAAMAVECLVVYLLLGQPTKARIQLLFYIMVVNVITNPAAQFAILFLADPVLLGSETLANLVLLTIELLVVMVEFGLLRWIFGRMYRRSLLDAPVNLRRTFCDSSFGEPGKLYWKSRINSPIRGHDHIRSWANETTGPACGANDATNIKSGYNVICGVFT